MLVETAAIYGGGGGIIGEENLCFGRFPSRAAEMSPVGARGFVGCPQHGFDENLPTQNRRILEDGALSGTTTCSLVLQRPRGSRGHASWPDSVGGVVLYVKRGLGMCQCRDTVASDAKG